MNFPPRSSVSRRSFLQTTALAATAMTLRGQGANEQVRIGLIGCGNRGNGLASHFSELAGARIVAVCDPDTSRMEMTAAKLASKPDQIRDYRQLLERKDIDAVVIASPNHWHALHTIHACQAGKDVYVEKPVSHDIWAGRQMVAAARLHNRIVQAGTQNRSDPGLIKAFDFIHQGNIGKITAVRGLCLQNRESIGKVAEPIQPPATVDYNLWLGPAMDEPIYRPRFHYDWHWVYNTGNGDIGNQGPHEMDLIRWVLGDPPMPTQVQSFGGRYGWDDAGTTANMQAAWFTLNDVPVVFEVNDMRIKPNLNSPTNYKGIRVGVIITCEGGEFRGGRGGGYVVGPDGKTKLAKFPGDAGAGHAQNFIDAIRSRRVEDLRAPVSQAHQSATLSHLANISLRGGETMMLSELRAALPDREDLREIYDRQLLQLKDWNVDSQTAPCALGTVLTLDPETETLVSPESCQQFYQPEYRKEFTVPEIS